MFKRILTFLFGDTPQMQRAKANAALMPKQKRHPCHVDFKGGKQLRIRFADSAEFKNYDVSPPVYGGIADYIVSHWIGVYPDGFEMTISNVTYLICPEGVDPDTLPWVGEISTPGL